MASAACCNTPAVGAPDNTPQSDFDEVGGLSAFVAGDRSSDRGVVLVYDIFGLFPQTKQGARLLAAELSGVVIVPDFFEGTAAEESWLPMDTEEKQTKMMGFFTEKANPIENLNKLQAVMEAVGLRYPTVKKWAVLGLCWGGKLAALSSGEKSPFAVSGQAHPSLLDIADAKAITIPHICLPSPDEPADVIEEYKAVLADRESEFETYPTMFHGWMGARADLGNEQNAKEFERGYKQVAAFFKRWL